MTSADADLLIGVDGGGSRCRVRLRDRSGNLLGSGVGGAANVYLDFTGAIASIHAATRSALEAAALDIRKLRVASAGLGLAGVSTPEIAARVGAALPEFGRVAVVADGVAACCGAHLGADGGLVIAGTGSVAVCLTAGRATSFGGRGFLLGDDGSGAWIGREIWRRALRAWDGMEPGSPLLDALMDEFGRDPARVIGWARAAPSHAFAAYAPRVFQAAENGEASPLAVVQAAADSIAELVAAVQSRQVSRISLVGGLADAIRPHLPLPVQKLLAPPLADALEGALVLAGLERPTVLT